MSTSNGTRKHAEHHGAVPPSNLRAEESVLGAMLLDSRAADEALGLLAAEDFYRPAHGHVFAAIARLRSAGEPVDAVTVTAELDRKGLTAEVGDRAALLDLTAAVPAISNVGSYAKLVADDAERRRYLRLARDLHEIVHSGAAIEMTRNEVEQATMAALAAARGLPGQSQGLRRIGDLLPELLDDLEARADRGTHLVGCTTGLVDLDLATGGLEDGTMVILGARPAMGKALALDTPLATPTGWTTMGAVQAGDQVFDETGTPCTVTYKSPVFLGHDCYEVVFNDGSTIIADADHLWHTWDHRAWASRRTRSYLDVKGPVAYPQYARDQSHKRAQPANRTTREIAESLVAPTADGRPNHRIEVAAPLELPEAELPIDPYVFGCWLGDGHTAGPGFTTMDAEIVAEFEAAGWIMSAKPHQNSGQATAYTIRHHRDDGRSLEFTKRLREAGVQRGEKRIPPSYLRASVKQRLALLQGIMDTDGCVVAGQTTCQISLSNRCLLDDFRELALSLGHKVGAPRHKVSNFGTDVWTLNFSSTMSVFRLSRKADAQKLVVGPNTKPRWRLIVDARPIASVPTQCIQVDSANHLYLAGREMIPTHNTLCAMGFARAAAGAGYEPLVFSKEMRSMELTRRVVSSESLVDFGNLRTGLMEEPEWRRVADGVGRLADLPLWIDDTAGITVAQIRTRARQHLAANAGARIVVIVDYLQLFDGEGESRQAEVAKVSRELALLARELMCPVVVLCQLNRGLESRADKRPVLSDLRDSGQIEQDADVVLFLYRDEVYDDASPDKGVAEIIIAKQRNGPTGRVRVAYRGRYQRFDNMARAAV